MDVNTTEACDLQMSTHGLLRSDMVDVSSGDPQPTFVGWSAAGTCASFRDRPEISSIGKVAEIKISSWGYGVAEALDSLDIMPNKHGCMDSLPFVLAKRSRTCQLPERLQRLDPQDTPILTLMPCKWWMGSIRVSYHAHHVSWFTFREKPRASVHPGLVSFLCLKFHRLSRRLTRCKSLPWPRHQKGLQWRYPVYLAQPFHRSIFSATPGSVHPV